MAKQPHEPCGARTRNGGTCKAQAGKGTDHLGSGRCKHHGGASHGAPKGNQNAVTNGCKREPIIRLGPEARAIHDELAARIETASPLDIPALADRIRSVELVLIAQMSELEERRSRLIAAGEWRFASVLDGVFVSDETAYNRRHEQIHKAIAHNQGLAVQLSGKFPVLPPPDDSAHSDHMLAYDDGERIVPVVISSTSTIEEDRARFASAGLDLSKRPDG